MVKAKKNKKFGKGVWLGNCEVQSHTIAWSEWDARKLLLDWSHPLQLPGTLIAAVSTAGIGSECVGECVSD